MPDNAPAANYDFESNPDGLPTLEGAVTQSNAPNYYVRVHFANLDSSGSPIDEPVLNMPTQLTNWGYGKMYTRPPVVPDDANAAASSSGLHMDLTLRRPTDPSVIYYYKRQKFAVNKTTSDGPVSLNAQTSTVQRTYTIQVSNVGEVSGTSKPVYDTPNVPTGFTISGFTVDGVETAQDSSGQYLISQGVTLDKEQSQSFTIVVTYTFDMSQETAEGIQNLGTCQTGENPDSTKGFYNAVDMENDEDGPANNNACTIATGEASWEKDDPLGNHLGGATFRLGGNQVDIGSGIANSSKADIPDCTTEGACSSAAYQDQDPRPGYFHIVGLPLVTEAWEDGAAEGPGLYLTERKSPDNYDRNEDQSTRLYFTYDVSTMSYRLSSRQANNRDTVDANGNVVNYPVTGNVTWRKVNRSNQLLSGAKWQITGGTLAEPLTVADCAADQSSDCASQIADSSQAASKLYYDTDQTAGVISMNLPLGTYTLKEIQAPDGYLLSDTTYEFTVTTQGTYINSGNSIVNIQIPTPGIPFTGGMGSDYFFIAGGAFAAFALITDIVRRRQRRQSHQA